MYGFVAPRKHANVHVSVRYATENKLPTLALMSNRQQK
jgi:hypothetical protein